MKIPLDWLKEYIKIDRDPKQIAESFTAIGLMLDKPIKDNILELEHRMDRSDWLSILGCARDLGAIEKIKLQSPEGEIPKSNGDGGVNIKVEAKDKVTRFNTRIFRNIEVKESPKWLKEYLESYGMPPINNIVDITNFVMVELGQPMHAQDLAKFSKQEIVLRNAKEGEEITTLLGEKVKVNKNTLVLSEGDNLIAIGGIVGGDKTRVTEDTKDIILDAGNYNQANIRKSSRELNIRNETVLRTEKFLHPHLTQVAIERATKLILELAGGSYYDNTDFYPTKKALTTMKFRFERVKTIGGIDINKKDMLEILKALEYRTLNETGNYLELEVPYFRTDVLVEDDIVADILRINNYNNIPAEVIDSAPPEEVTPKIYDFEERLKDEMVKLGFHEHITNPLVKSVDEKTQITLENALNSEQDGLRTRMGETLRPIIRNYNKHKINEVRLFEVGKTYHKTGSAYEDIGEIRKLYALYENKNLNIREQNNRIKSTLYALLQNLGIDKKELKIKTKPTENKATIYYEKLELGELGLDYFMFYTRNLFDAPKKLLRVASEVPNTTTKDFTYELGINETIGDEVEKHYQDKDVLDVKHTSDFEKNGKKHITLRVTLKK